MTNKEVAEKALKLISEAETTEEVLNAIEWHDAVNDPDIDVEYDGDTDPYLDLWGDLLGDKKNLIIDEPIYKEIYG